MLKQIQRILKDGPEESFHYDNRELEDLSGTEAGHANAINFCKDKAKKEGIDPCEISRINTVVVNKISCKLRPSNIFIAFTSKANANTIKNTENSELK